ncbi:4-hydroxy-tetrahydrodipicolinate synthase [Streptomyces roseirectus]|uniref:4-hydroxy-tetrahydrodipicolinate synthase n=1 Tax=Streptomyces roseirectus TaxID=2768066 RepID=A0A7H0IKS4_9ACTN|nr:4-hydroxy-tetrahydrodipicolinate synthase [Streptomyces roseirectus]QNP73390.1 4-hydroxy-tetrahydrodipicolinate synthase [Streptomyces roseirectus]
MTPTFGRALCAMITPFTETGALDLDGAQRLAAHLITEGCDGLVLSGTTGESPTTTDAEKSALLKAVRQAVGPTVPLLTGVGTSDTHHTLQLTAQAADSGATGILLAPPSYSRPPQDAVESHLREIADASELPVMLYDIPARTATRLEPTTLLSLADHPRIIAVKDCSYDFLAAQKLISRTDLAYYAGCDEHNLALRAIGATGYVSTVANAAPRQVRAVLDHFNAGNTSAATRTQHHLIPLTELMTASGLPATVTAKALLTSLTLPAGPVRRPLLNAPEHIRKTLRTAYDELTTRTTEPPLR